MDTRSLARILAALLACASAPARAEETGWRTTGILAARMNPEALAADLEVAWRQRLHAADHPLLALNHVRVAGALELTPASVTPRVDLELQPLSILSLGVGYAPVYYTGGFRLAQSYPSPRARQGGGAFRPVAQGPGGAYPLLVHQLLVRGALQARVKEVAVRAAVEAARVEARLHGDDRVVYDGARDIDVYRHGWVAQGDLDVVWLPREELVLGVRTTLVEAWYPRDAFAAGDRGGLADRITARAGPLVRYALFRGRGGLLDEGAVIAAAQWWLAHPDRAGGTSPRAVPLAFAALEVSGRP